MHAPKYRRRLLVGVFGLGFLRTLYWSGLYWSGLFSP
jgi:hypothetical protein